MTFIASSLRHTSTLAGAIALSFVAACSGASTDRSNTATDTAVDTIAGSATAVASPTVVITEIHFHPAADGDAEFVEVANVGAGTVDLDGWCLDGVDFCFGATLIESGELVVVDESEFGGGLDNGGEVITLLDDELVERDRVAYSDDEPWPVAADGDGPSLVRLDTAASGSDPSNWAASAPTPGATGLAAVDLGWSAVEVPIWPAAGQPIIIPALFESDATELLVEYVVGFGEASTKRITSEGDSTADAAGHVLAELPPQSADTLVRFRLIAELADGSTRHWPSPNRGTGWAGIVTEHDGRFATDLSRVQWFVPPEGYEQAVADRDVTGDDGVESVVAVNGVVVDGAKFRVKGESSRALPKLKWHVALPDGVDIDVGEPFENRLDEFDLHSSYVDRSYLREPLGNDVARRAGAPFVHVDHVQLELNGAFYGLYLIVENDDGRWRDRVGLGDAAVYRVNIQGDFFADPPEDFKRLPAENATLPPNELREIYDLKGSGDGADDELREFLIHINDDDPEAWRSWIDTNVDVESVVATLATNLVAHHLDYGHKNLLLAYHDGKWSTVPIDFDLTFGRRYLPECELFCDQLIDGPDIAWSPDGLFGGFQRDDELRSRVIDATLELLDQVPEITRQIDVYASDLSDEVERDIERWGTWRDQSWPESVNDLREFTGRHDAALREHLNRPPDDFVLLTSES